MTSPLRDFHDESAASKSSTTSNDIKYNFISEGFEGNSPFNELQSRMNSVVGPSQVLVYDTSLRDGTQGEAVSVSCDDKLKIATRLSNFDVDFIEAGWPGSNPKDAEFFHRAKTELDSNIRKKLVAFGSTRRKKVDAKDDPQMRALVESGAPTICMVAKAHLWQVTDILRATPEENLEMIRDSVEYLVSLDRRVFVDLEHFFDGYKFDKEYVMKCCKEAFKAGASALVLCDTNGGSMPWEIEQITQSIVETFDVTVGIHAHNDCGMAVANSIVSVKSGAGLVQGTINGIGERTGNADLCSIVPALALHINSNMKCKETLAEITSLSRFVDETMNRKPNSAAPFVGSSAFAHKGGLHVAAMERSPMSYQHIDPSAVGNIKRILISELSGRQNIIGKIKEFCVENISEEAVSERAMAILNRVKQLESKGYTFEGAEASVDIMILHATKGYCPPFVVLDYSAQVFDSHLDPSKKFDTSHDQNNSSYGPTARATIKVRTMDLDVEEDVSLNLTEKLPYTDHLEVSDGNGPVDALASALKRALIPSHPSLGTVELIDYKVRILDPESATGASTRVMIEFRDIGNETTWTTVSVDQNVISASLNALVDGYEYALIEYAPSCMLCDDFY
eukprot:CAMPEP_0184855208 /NCGR_PEP_ID=MMETSP0580-20130426/516_1 /TAXON_ID=1118495 /ORGANISM="Dactyliosolen fragilissimus" /LENGTH=621 /DNA_ID=CAMNT_0027349663 /DNA_START=189 /DNA_END=2054 /DNA_ORIENTATION=+